MITTNYACADRLANLLWEMATAECHALPDKWDSLSPTVNTAAPGTAYSHVQAALLAVLSVMLPDRDRVAYVRHMLSDGLSLRQALNALREEELIVCGYCDQGATRVVRDSVDGYLCIACARDQTDGPVDEYVRPLTDADRRAYLLAQIH